MSRPAAAPPTRGREILTAVRRNKGSLVGAILIVLVVVFALAAPWIATHGPEDRVGPARASPSSEFLLGTDTNGFDVFSRLVFGARTALLAALSSICLALLVGVPLGLLAGWHGGWVDGFLLRVVDLMLAFPSVLLAIAVAAALGKGSLTTVILAVGIVMIPVFIRQVRAAVLQVKVREYVAAARALGVPTWRILFRTVLPNCLGPILVLATLSTGMAILDVAGLSFLGLGPPETAADWGVMLTKGQSYMRQGMLWMVLPPGLAIGLTVLGFNLLGDGLRDALDPRRE